MNLENFKTITLGNTYGNPPPILVPNMGSFQGQCVSLVRQYIEYIYGIVTGPWGDAVNWWDNPTVQQYFDQITDGSKQEGDILVWGKGSLTSQYGHIAIWYQGKLLNQNWANSLKVTINDFFSSGYLGVLRIKGGHMDQKVVEEAVNYDILATGVGQGAGAYPTQGQLDYATKQFMANPAQGFLELAKGNYLNTTNQQMRYLYFNPEGNAKTVKELEAANARIIELEKELAEAGGEYIPSPQQYQRK